MERFWLYFFLIFIGTLNSAIAATLLVANTTSNTVSLLDESALKPLKELSVGYMPHEVAVTPNGKFALVSNFGDLLNVVAGSTVSVIDINQAKVVKTIQLPKRSRPHGLAFLSDTEVLVTAQGIQSLLYVNLETDTVMKTLALPGAGAHMVILDAAQHYAYITNTDSGSICKVDLKSWSVVAEVKIGKHAEGITLTPDENLILSTNSKDHQVTILRAKDLMLVKTIKTHLGPERVVMAKDGKSAVVLNSISGTAQVIDIASLSIVKSFPSTSSHAPLFAPANIVIKDDGMTAYITNFLANNIAYVDLVQGAVLKTFKTAYQPNGLAISPINVADAEPTK